MGDVAVALMVVMAGIGLSRGDFTVGDFVLFSSYLFFVSRFPAMVGSYISEIAQQRVVLDRLHAITPDAPPASLVAHGDLHEEGINRGEAEGAVVAAVGNVIQGDVNRHIRYVNEGRSFALLYDENVQFSGCSPSNMANQSPRPPATGGRKGIR